MVLSAGARRTIMEDSSTPLTAFITRFGNGWLPFGLCSAPAQYRRMLLQVGQVRSLSHVWMNLVGTESFEEHLIDAPGVKLTPEQCGVFEDAIGSRVTSCTQRLKRAANPENPAASTETLKADFSGFFLLAADLWLHIQSFRAFRTTVRT